MCVTCGSEGGGGCVSHVRVEEDVYHMWKLGWWRVCIICGSEKEEDVCYMWE